MSDRLFFAFWPDDALRGELVRRVPEWTQDYACKLQRPDQWHVTVEFLGTVETARQPALHEVGARLESFFRGSPEIVLDRLEWWKKPQVLCLAASALDESIRGFAAALKGELASRGFEPESRPFRPHLTLARKARLPVPAVAVEPIRWPLRSLVLVRSVSDASGSRYEPFVRWNVAQTL